MRPWLAALAFLSCVVPVLAQSHIAPTEARTAAEQAKTFKLPPGFEIQLVATDPDIGKPIQIAFDAKGRLWVTTSRHYPFAATGGEKPSDRLFVLSDFGADGKAKKIETFANDLNIPIGILPLPDCKSCLVSNVGNIVKLTDTDGDGKADKRETILTGFGSIDTHGMMNSFLLLPDGWVYATHGFRNESVVKAKDGSEVRMQSGNTFRFKPDGSRVEPWTFGQVNPFGLCVDPWLNLYTADCHSKPITQLIRGAHYQSFGKPHDGLGYAPHVTQHEHASTALCGLVWYDAPHFPKEWGGVMFLGNVTGNSINCDRIEWKGASPVAKELPDFLRSSDPWFRPTDIKLGPDGALYVADFYNRIIGHYEVDLKHPLRDKDHGRVWRIVYKGTDGKAKLSDVADLSTADRDAVTKAVSDPNIATRMLAWQQVNARFPGTGPKGLVPAEARESLSRSISGPHLTRSCVDTLIANPDPANVAPLVKLIKATPAGDTHLRMAARIALRNALRDADGWSAAKDADPAVVADVALGVPSKAAAAFLLARIKDGSRDAALAGHVGRYGTDADATDAATILKHAPVAALALVRGLQARGAGLPTDAKASVESAVVAGLGAALPAAVLASCDLAASLRMESMFDPLVKYLGWSVGDDNQRGAAMAALLAIDAAKATPILVRTLTDPASTTGLLDRTAQVLATSNQPVARDALIASLQTAPARLAGIIATGLAGSPQGADALLNAVKDGKASPRLLQERSVSTKLLAIDKGRLKPRIDELTKGLPSADAKLAELIRSRSASFVKTTPDLKLGKAAFTTHCAKCHQLGGEGAKVGPQLDGIGARGADRLLEDILDPNRNVDGAFRATVLTMLDGRVLTGQLLREEGQVTVVVDANGKEVRAEAKDIDKKATSPLSVMPANVETAIPEADFHHLIGYLLEQKAKPAPEPKK